MPERIKRERIKGYRIPPNTVCVSIGGAGEVFAIKPFTGESGEDKEILQEVSNGSA